jgi:hypothetical protein
MNSQALQFFTSDPKKEFHFHRAWFVDEKVSWEEAAPSLIPRGWFELSRLSSADRVEFTKDFWFSKLPFHPHAAPLLEQFFERLDDVAPILIQETKEAPLRGELIYSLRDDSCFFRGSPPANVESLEMIAAFSPRIPRDFLAFSAIHNGFGKLSERGLFPLEEQRAARERLLQLLLSSETPLRMGGAFLDPHSLYPFYEEYGTDSFQCFCSEWYPGSEMGNVYFSGIDHTVSEITYKKEWLENRAFPTFFEWLVLFLSGATGES